MPEAMINGCRHYFEDHGSGDPLVMLHGASSSGRMLADAAEHLEEHFRVIVPDMRGMGRSEHVPALPPSAWVDDVRGLLDHLGLEEAHVYGTSLGSRVALRFAIDHPERTTSVVMDAPIIAISEEGSSALNAGLDLDRLPPERQAAHREHHGEDWADVVRNYFAIRNVPELQAYFDLRELARTVKAPVLVLRGDIDDAVHPLAHAFELHQRIPVSWLAIVPACPSGALRGSPLLVERLIAEFADRV